MKHFKAHVFIASLCIGIGSFLMTAGLAFGQPCEQGSAKIVSVQGAVQARQSGETNWIPVRLNQTFCPGDIIRVLKNSRTAIALSNDTLIRVDQHTTITFTGVEQKKTFLINLIRGVAYFFSRSPKSVKVATPFVNAAVEGTEFYVRVEDSLTFLSVFEGRVLAENEIGSLVRTGGQAAEARVGKAPVGSIVVRPRDAVQWTLYYPPIIDWRSIDFADGKETDWQGMARKSVDYYWQGDMTGAFSALEKTPEEIRDPRFYLYRAALSLTVGRIGVAKTDINKALTLDPSNSYAIALQSIMAVVQNEKDRALELANRAVELDPKSSTALVALSYARQAHFNIQGSLDSLKNAVELGPENALAWSRLAELYLSVGELTKAATASRQAVALNPGLARTQTVLGFTLIDRIKINAAKETFSKAIKLDSAAPLPRLGLGLAKIRGGDLKEGRIEIEIAACLDPNNSLIRSYLGKAYYEEKRDKLAEDQYAVAKKLDPLDPTAWFYDAIRKQTINRPVEALQDMQKSIELNDNRAVYRSRFLLDEDLAARSASLGRIYNDLGFQQLGLVEGWKSVNTSPNNYSSHRLLSDLYAALPRHEIARVSELLQSQLLQPINITPLQPKLAETNLLILNGLGPSDPSFNEFNPLFLRNRFAMQGSGVTGDNDTWGGELIHSGLWGGISYSAGYYRFLTDGFRENNDLEQDILNLFFQGTISPQTSFQAEFRYNDLDKGDLPLRFDPNNFSDTLEQDEKITSARFGFHHNFSPRSNLIGSIIYKDGKGRAEIVENFVTTEVTPPLITTTDGRVDLETSLDDTGYLAEVQHQWEYKEFNLISGIGYFDSDRDIDITKSTSGLVTVEVPPLPPLSQTPFSDIQSSSGDSNINHTNLYAYSLINYPRNLTWTFGASADFLDGATKDRNQFNPKLGATWYATPRTTIRVAAFRVLKRMLISSQTIEPTQVAGFNQFFDDSEGTDSWRFGGAIDHKIFSTLYGGLEFTRREMDVPFLDQDLQDHEVDWDESHARAYLYWTPHNWLVLSGEYSYERLNRDADFTGILELTDVDTNRLLMATRFFHPTGLNFGLRATYYHQDGTFEDQDNNLFDGNDQFWLIDASIGYRLPKRYGLITLGVRNLLDEDFKFQDTDAANPTVYPERFVFGRLTLSF